MSNMARHKRSLLLTFDAFGTLFTPREPIAKQYSKVARELGMLHVTDVMIKEEFKKAFNHESAVNPNYGKETDLGAQQWWANVIEGTFRQFIPQNKHLPDQLVPTLLDHFSTQKAYKLYDDVLPFFEAMRSIKRQHDSSQTWPWEKTVIGVVTNSDDRVPSILRSLGLSVGSRRVENVTGTSAQDDFDNEDISFTVLSYDVGSPKPDIKMFEAAKTLLVQTLSAQMSVSTNSVQELLDEYVCIHIGDDVQNDVVGATKAGWIGMLLDRGGIVETGAEENSWTSEKLHRDVGFPIINHLSELRQETSASRIRALWDNR